MFDGVLLSFILWVANKNIPLLLSQRMIVAVSLPGYALENWLKSVNASGKK